MSIQDVIPLAEQDREKDREQDIATMFKALGDPTRLRIFNFLRSCCGPVAVEDSGDVRPVQSAKGARNEGAKSGTQESVQEGPTVGEVCCRITGAERINSTISHHLKELRLAGLITIQQRGKNRICGVNSAAVERLTAYLNVPPNAEAQNDGCC